MTAHVMSEVDAHIKSWIEHVSEPQEKLGNMPVCPFAKKAVYQLINTELNALEVPDVEFKLVIYILPDDTTDQQMTERCLYLNNQHPTYVFLPDHKTSRAYVKGVLTNNCKYNLVLCQPKEEIEKGRESLLKTKYYTFFDDNYWNQQSDYESIVPDNHWNKITETVT
jgi:hypothetical protein